MSNFVYERTVRLHETDATGAIYFTEQLKMAQEAFEAFLQERGISFSEILKKSFAFPIVHVEADYLAPLQVGDPLHITVSIAKVGTTSLTMAYQFHRPQGEEVGRVSIVHVCIDKETREPLSIPNYFL